MTILDSRFLGACPLHQVQRHQVVWLYLQSPLGLDNLLDLLSIRAFQLQAPSPLQRNRRVVRVNHADEQRRRRLQSLSADSNSAGQQLFFRARWLDLLVDCLIWLFRNNIL